MMMMSVGMVVVIMIVLMGVDVVGAHFAAVVGHDAGDVFELDGGVMDAEAAADFGEFLENCFAFGVGHVVYQHVGTEGVGV